MPNAHNQTIKKLVILSLSNFHRVKNEVKARRQSAAGISFKILVAFCIDVTSRWQATKTRSEIPLRLLARASACSLALNPQKFDYANRFAVFSAQDDIQWFCFLFVANYFYIFSCERVLRGRGGIFAKVPPHSASPTKRIPLTISSFFDMIKGRKQGV